MSLLGLLFLSIAALWIVLAGGGLLGDRNKANLLNWIIGLMGFLGTLGAVGFIGTMLSAWGSIDLPSSFEWPAGQSTAWCECLTEHMLCRSPLQVGSSYTTRNGIFFAAGTFRRLEDISG